MSTPTTTPGAGGNDGGASGQQQQAAAAAASRFTAQNRTTQERVSAQTVGLVKLSDFRKRRAEVLEQQEREALEAASGNNNSSNKKKKNKGKGGTSGGGDAGRTGTPAGETGGDDDGAGSGAGSSGADGLAGGGGGLKNKKKKLKGALLGRKAAGGAKLSFAGNDDEEEEDEDDEPAGAGSGAREKADGSDGALAKAKGVKIAANAAVAVLPRAATTKAAQRRDAAERETIRRQFAARQEAVRAAEIAVPFVFYDGSSTPGGVVRVKKGDFIWVFLDRSRKMAAQMGEDKGGRGPKGAGAKGRTEWARVGVDDLLMVRGSVIMPHHFDFHFFIINKTTGPGGRKLFDYSDDAPIAPEATATAENNAPAKAPALLSNPTKSAKLSQVNIDTLEGAQDDPTFTKVVDRRWYERNKHIYPASVWQEFDAEKDYRAEVRKDAGGNTFFFS